MSDLPPGFVLDQSSAPSVPDGFVVDHPSRWMDAAKSTAAGLENATIGTLGTVGDMRDLLSRGVDALGRKTGYDLSTIKSALGKTPLGIANAFPNSADVRSVSDPVVPPEYEPQTTAGRYLKTGAEFLPGMADPELAGPGALRAAGRIFATRVAAPAIASETAGQLTNGTEAEPYARVAGALLGGAGAAKTANAIGEAQALKAATPSTSAVKDAASNSYKALTSRNVAIPLAPTALDTLSDTIKTTLNNQGIRPSTADKIHNAVQEIRTPANAAAPDVADLVAARQNVKSLLGSPDANKAGATVALPMIESAIEQQSPGTMAQIREADKNWSAVKASDAVDKRLARADLRAGGEHSGANIGNKVRQQITNYLLSNESRFLPPQARSDLEKVVKGTATQNAVRTVANILGGGGGLGMLAGGTAGYEAGGWPGAVAGAAAGKTLKFVNNRAVLSQAEKAAAAIRRASPVGQSMPMITPPKMSVSLAALRPALFARPKDKN
jgi:hypothetical protein